MIHLSGVHYESFADAEGVSCVLFFSGCNHKCPGCHSPHTHSFDSGALLADDLIDTINQEIDKRPFLNALVLSGGDPMYSASEIIHILPKLHIPNNNIWVYSGFTYEEIVREPAMKALLEQCNVLVDGPFDARLRDVTLTWRGSSNQRVIDVKKSLEQGTVVLYE